MAGKASERRCWQLRILRVANERLVFGGTDGRELSFGGREIKAINVSSREYDRKVTSACANRVLMLEKW